MTTASELRHYLETGYGGPLEGPENRIDAFVERGAPDIIEKYQKLEDWLSNKSDFHNSVRSYLGVIGALVTRRYVAKQIRGDGDVNDLALATQCLAKEFLYCIRVHKRFPKNVQFIRMEEIAFILLQVITVGWKEHAEFLARLALKHFPDLFNEGVTFGPFPYFVFDLVNDWLKTNVAVDCDFRRSELHQSTQWPGSDIYVELLAQWRTADLASFDALMSKAADYHISQSRNDTDFVNEDGDMDERHFDFTDVNHWLFPVELLAILRLRAWSGIGNPAQLSHDLFKVSPLGSLPVNIPVWPAHDLLDKVEEKYKTILPELPPLPTLADLPGLRAEQS
jgi:hypothetical protein